jgi:hypothetical protein
MGGRFVGGQPPNPLGFLGGMAPVSKGGGNTWTLGLGFRGLGKRRAALWGHNFSREIQVDGAPRAYPRASGGILRRSFCSVPPKADRS